MVAFQRIKPADTSNNEYDFLGLWKATKSVEKDGSTKKTAAFLCPKIEFLTQGIANVQFLWIKRQVKWEPSEDGATITNERDGKNVELVFDDGELIMIGDKGAKVIFEKADNRIKVTQKDIARSQPKPKRFKALRGKTQD